MVVAVSVLSLPLSNWVSGRARDSGYGAEVGSHVHAVTSAGVRTTVIGHAANATSPGPGDWASRRPSVGHLYAAVGTTRGLLVASESGISVSRDDGRSFSSVWTAPSIGAVRALGIDDLDGGTVFAATAAGEMFVSNDQGASFEKRSVSTTRLEGVIAVSPTVSSDALAVDAARGLVRTRDGGRSWVDAPVVDETGTDVGPQVVAVAQDPDNDLRIVVASESEVYQSNDGGTRWAALDGPPQIAALTFSASSEVLLASAANGRSVTYRQRGDGWVVVV